VFYPIVEPAAIRDFEKITELNTPSEFIRTNKALVEEYNNLINFRDEVRILYTKPLFSRMDDEFCECHFHGAKNHGKNGYPKCVVYINGRRAIICTQLFESGKDYKFELAEKNGQILNVMKY
jgi:hypothetical protein